MLPHQHKNRSWIGISPGSSTCLTTTNSTHVQPTQRPFLRQVSAPIPVVAAKGSTVYALLPPAPRNTSSDPAITFQLTSLHAPHVSVAGRATTHPKARVDLPSPTLVVVTIPARSQARPSGTGGEQDYGRQGQWLQANDDSASYGVDFNRESRGTVYGMG